MWDRGCQYDSTEPTGLFVYTLLFPLMGEDIVCNAADSTTGSVGAICERSDSTVY